jgi:MFS family permease
MAEKTSSAKAGDVPENINTSHSNLYSWYVVSVFLLAYIFAFVDRQILSLMVEPLKQALDLSDTRVSLLHGMAFALFYTFLGLPIGRLVDSYNRKKIAAVGIALWSLMTAGCGLAQNFWSLFLLRMGVGVGEAALSPAAYSIIADYFPNRNRGKALAVYTLGISIGIGLALMGGGAVIDFFSRKGGLDLPFFGHLDAWQLAFLIAGLPGLLVALLMCTVKEPLRQDCLKGHDLKKGIPLKQVFTFVWERWQALGSMYLGFALVIVANYAILAWVPTLFIRTYEWNIAIIGFWFGLINMLFGTAGGYCGGWLVDHLYAKGYKDAPVRTVLCGSLLAVPFAALAPLASSAVVSLVLFALATFFLFFQSGVAPVAIQNIVPNQMRGQLSALQLFVQNIVGFGIGATSVALLTDYLFNDDKMLRYSMSIVVCVALPLSAALLWYCLSRYRDCMERSGEWTSH